MVKAIKRLWNLATCQHRGCVAVQLGDEEWIVCRRCGRILQLSSEGERTHNPHLDYNAYGDRLDKSRPYFLPL